jgi:tape measure domain-containing protein
MSQLEQIASAAQQYHQMFQNNVISASEFKELCEDLKIVEQIQIDSNNFEKDQQFRAVILSIIQVASLAV